MADATTPNRVPRPPRVSASAGVRSASSIADGNDLLLGAHRKNMLIKKASSVAESDSGKSATQAEIERLKQQLKDSEKRLMTPVKGLSARRGRESIAQLSNGLTGERYAASPYTPVKPHVMWEPFEQDPEVRAELERLKQSEDRIAKRHEAWSVEWIKARASKRDDKSIIAPPNPPVFSAADDDAVIALANQAEQFMSTGRPSPQKSGKEQHSPSNVKLDEERHTRTYSPAMPSRSMSRSTPTSNRRVSSVHPSMALLTHLGLANAVEIDMPDPQEVVADREGDILGDAFILKRDLFDAAFARKDVIGVIGGAPAFRMIPRFNIGAVAQAHISGVRTILNEVGKQWQGPIVWINLREEPIVYINNRAYTVRAAENPLEPVPTPGIKADRLEELETKLRGEVIREGIRFGGNVIVHKETSSGAVEAQWESVDDESVLTLRGLFERVTASGYDVRYHRLPVTPHFAVTLNQFDVVFDVCQRHPLDPIIMSCQTGRGRSTVAMIIATIVRFYQHKLNKGRMKSHMSLLNRDEYSPGLHKLVQLVGLLPEGRDHEYRVSVLCELTGKASNLPDRILAALKTQITAAGVGLLSRYCHLVAFSSYCDQRILQGVTTLTFAQWVKENKSLDMLLSSFASHEAIREITNERVSTPALDAPSARSRRDGEVLVNGMGLVAYELSPATPSISGVAAFRQVHMHAPLFSCGRQTTDARNDMIYNICEVFRASPQVDWVDTRAEPHVYLNGVAYTASFVRSIFHEHLNSMRASGAAIEEIERRLKQDVQAELRVNNGYMEVLLANAESKIITTSKVLVTSVQTPAEYAASFAAAIPINYRRVPFAASEHINVLSVHPMIEVATAAPTNGIVIIEDTTGGLRSTVALNIFCLARLAKIRPLASVSTEAAVHEAFAVAPYAAPLHTNLYFGGPEEADSLGQNPVKKELLIAASMAQMLAAGSILMATESVCGVSGRGKEWNLLDRANILVTEMTSAVGDQRAQATQAALATAASYVYVYLSAVYVTEALQRGVTSRFEDWVNAHPEIRLMLEKMNEHPSAGLKFVEPQNLFLETDQGSVERRRGNVLTSNFGLKADHFPGAIRKGMVPFIPGVPNFRKVNHVNVYGVGIPTRRGVLNLLKVLGAASGALDLHDEASADPAIPTAYPRVDLYHPGVAAGTAPPTGRVVWVNMREEPLLYVGDRPFVLRDLANPYVNIELTGITPPKIEAIEAALVVDCLEDAKKYNNQFLVHDEIKPGVMGGLWEPGTPETIQTLRQVYDSAAANGAKVTFFRLPVTDEQMPEITDFDLLVQAVLPDVIAAHDYPDGEALSFVFNCQMGRGRTTTGMVIACMLIGLVEDDYFPRLKADYPNLYPASASKWSNGHYSVIQDLMRILVDGREAKQRVDLILEACDKMQNLRTAIEVFKLQYESPDVSESQRARAVHHGQHYLMRYFFLIVFNSYLHEAWDPSARRLRMTFVDYMHRRDELRHFAERCELK